MHWNLFLLLSSSVSTKVTFITKLDEPKNVIPTPISADALESVLVVVYSSVSTKVTFDLELHEPKMESSPINGDAM